jgi:hypothetical protein
MKRDARVAGPLHISTQIKMPFGSASPILRQPFKGVEPVKRFNAFDASAADSYRL